MKYVKQSAWLELKKELFESNPICKLCGIRPAVHLHHAVINKAKVRNKKLNKLLDVKENALEVCEVCHKTADGFWQRRDAYKINSKRYGWEHMREWYDNLPLKIKERME